MFHQFQTFCRYNSIEFKLNDIAILKKYMYMLGGGEESNCDIWRTKEAVNYHYDLSGLACSSPCTPPEIAQLISSINGFYWTYSVLASTSIPHAVSIIQSEVVYISEIVGL